MAVEDRTQLHTDFSGSGVTTDPVPSGELWYVEGATFHVEGDGENFEPTIGVGLQPKEASFSSGDLRDNVQPSVTSKMGGATAAVEAAERITLDTYAGDNFEVIAGMPIDRAATYNIIIHARRVI